MIIFSCDFIEDMAKTPMEWMEMDHSFDKKVIRLPFFLKQSSKIYSVPFTSVHTKYCLTYLTVFINFNF